MRSVRFFPLFLLAAACAGAQTLPTTHNPRVVVTAVPNTAYPNMGLAFLSDGRMLLLTASVGTTGNGALGFGDVTPPDGNQALYLVSGLTAKGALTGVTAVKILDSLTGPPPGVVVVNDTVYVQDRTAFYRVVSLAPTNGTSKSKNAVRLINAPTVDSNFTWTAGESFHQYVFTPQYHDGRFYAPYSGSIGGGGHSDAPPTSTFSGAMLSWARGVILPEGALPNAGFEKEAGGLRSPNGMSGNGEYMVFTENQGGFNPGNAIRLFKPGQPAATYGARQATPANTGGTIANTLRNWAEDLPYVPPLLWLPHAGTLARSLSQPLYIDHGPYEGHWIVGDVTVAGMGRIFIDDVDSSGKYQASYQFFTGGVNSPGGVAPGRAINRLAMSPDSAVYIGTILGLGAWPAGSPGPVARMTFRDTAVFEILAVRSRKSVDGAENGVEVVFSEPVNPATLTDSAVELLQHDYLLGGVYGCNPALCPTKVPQVTSVSLSNDKRTAFIGIATPDTSIGAAHIGTPGVGGNPPGVWGGPGKQDRTLRVTLKGVTSASGQSPLYNVAWMGWNYQAETRFDPSRTSTALAGARAGRPARLASALSVRAVGGRVEVRLDLPGPAEAALYDMTGALRARVSGTGRLDLDARALGPGLHLLRVKHGGAVHARPLLPQP